MPLKLYLLIILILLIGPSGLAQDPMVDPDTQILHCGSLPQDLNLDGILDEPAWASADSIEGLTMVEPEEGGTPTGRTRVQVLCDANTLVIGIRCDDPEPEGIVSHSVARDAGLRSEDHIKIVLGTFRDGRSGYVFAVNPSGARYDALVSRRGESENSNWDCLWEAKTTKDDRGWSAEIRIPVTSLNFKQGISAWHFNVRRKIQRNMETNRWAGTRRDYRITQTRHAGLLASLPDFSLGQGLSIRPSLAAGYGRPGRNDKIDQEISPGIDITQKLGPNLLASLTANTDFAETEVDTQRTNLTRFPLFFPEKRDFFQEGSNYFDFGLGVGRDALPFHSRRIGLVDGNEVPLRVGAKLHGQVDGTHLGLLAVNTSHEPGVSPEANMGVVRVKQNIWEESSVGFIATAGDPLSRRDSWTLGGDFTYQTSKFLGDKNFLAGFWGLTMDREDTEGSSRSAVGTKIDFPNDLWDIRFIYMRVGEDFDPSLGFVPRPGIQKYDVGVEFAPHPEWSWVRRMYYEFFTTYITNLEGELESYRVFTAPMNWTLESGDSIEFNVIRQGENLTEDFEISDGIVIPMDRHAWTRYRVQAGTASKRSLSGEASWWFGPFYDGRLNTYELELEWNPIALLTLAANGERNIARLEDGSFTEDVYGTKVRLNFSPDLNLSSFIQYNTEDKTLGTNTRLHWTITPASKLHLVYNRNWDRLSGDWRRESYDTRLKLEYEFRF